MKFYCFWLYQWTYDLKFPDLCVFGVLKTDLSRSICDLGACQTPHYSYIYL